MDCEAIFAAAPGGSSAYCYMCPVIYGNASASVVGFEDLSTVTYTHDQSSLYSAIYGGYTCEDSAYYCFEMLTFLLCPETCTGLADDDVVAAYEFSSYGHATCVGMASEYWSLSVNEQYKMAYACPLSFMYQLSSLGFGDNSTLLESESALAASDYAVDQGHLYAAAMGYDYDVACSSDDCGDEGSFVALACPITCSGDSYPYGNGYEYSDHDDHDGHDHDEDDGHGEELEEAEEAVVACIAANCPEGFDTQYYSYSYEADEDWFDGTCRNQIFNPTSM